MDFAALLRRCARWDFSVSANAFSTLVWERVYPTRYESLETGYPRNDALANGTDEDVRRIRADLGIDPGQVAVLYAPTHREYQDGFVPLLDIGAVAEGWAPTTSCSRACTTFTRRTRCWRRCTARAASSTSRRTPRSRICASRRTYCDGLLIDHVRLRRPGPPDRDLRARLGDLPAVRGTYFDL